MDPYHRPYHNDRGWQNAERYKMANGKNGHEKVSQIVCFAVNSHYENLYTLHQENMSV